MGYTQIVWSQELPSQSSVMNNKQIIPLGIVEQAAGDNELGQSERANKQCTKLVTPFVLDTRRSDSG